MIQTRQANPRAPRNILLNYPIRQHAMYVLNGSLAAVLHFDVHLRLGGWNDVSDWNHGRRSPSTNTHKNLPFLRELYCICQYTQ